MRDLTIPEERHPEKAHRPDQEQPRKPAWIRVKAPTSAGYRETARIMREHRLTTVCEEAGCPNVGECWSQGHATMMIMGEVCTRGCTFCNVATGRPDALDAFEQDPRPAELRTHFHVPVFLEQLGAFTTTRYAVQDALRLHRETPLSDHLEIETYTWDVRPAELKQGDITDYVSRELEFVRDELLG